MPVSDQEDFSYEIFYKESHDTEAWKPLSDNATIEWKGSYWVKVVFDDIVDDDYVLQAGNPYMRNVSFFDARNRLINKGNSLKIPKRTQVLLLYYPFLDEKSTEKIGLTVLPEMEFVKQSASEKSFQSAFLSVIGFIAFASFVFSIGSKDRVYVHYTLYLFSILYFFAYQYGILGELIPFIDVLPPTWLWISSASLTIFYILFAQSFLNLREADYVTYKIMVYGLYFVLWVVITETISYLINFDIQHSVFYKGFIVLVQIVLMLIILVRVYRLKNSISRVFILGLIVLMSTTIAGQIVSTYHLVDESNRVIQGGLLLDVFIFTIGMAMRTSQVYKDRQKVQENLIEQLQLNEKLQKVYTEELESKVLKRTSQLEERNKENETLLREVHHRVKKQHSNDLKPTSHAAKTTQ
jgi:hypothetical protein